MIIFKFYNFKRLNFNILFFFNEFFLKVNYKNDIDDLTFLVTRQYMTNKRYKTCTLHLYIK